jgi:YD repeat-containing protein
LHDPDLGFIAYSVDPIGRVYQQVTPNQRPNKSSTMVYDMLDRMVERHDPDLESYWVYDTASKGIGQLARA